jgi:hypothetical protein
MNGGSHSQRQAANSGSSAPLLFPDFARVQLEVSGTTINAVYGGAGPPVLLLHGCPQTHAIWHRVAPALAERFTVVCSDLRGYGDSGKPPSDESHGPYSKRVMALDHPAGVSCLAVLDIVPTETIYASLEAQILCYPVLDFEFASESHTAFDGVLFDRASLEWERDQYLGGQEPTELAAPPARRIARGAPVGPHPHGRARPAPRRWTPLCRPP